MSVSAGYVVSADDVVMLGQTDVEAENEVTESVPGTPRVAGHRRGVEVGGANRKMMTSSSKRRRLNFFSALPATRSPHTMTSSRRNRLSSSVNVRRGERGFVAADPCLLKTKAPRVTSRKHRAYQLMKQKVYKGP